jgi:O-antigen/teichoic acid export membrane protein
MWYKLTDMTRYGAYISIGGAIVTITLNVILIPVYGYKGSAFALFVTFFGMMVISYFLGQKYYPIPYNLKRIFTYFLIAGILFLISIITIHISPIVKYLINTVLLIIFLFSVYQLEKNDLKRLFKINKKK